MCKPLCGYIVLRKYSISLIMFLPDKCSVKTYNLLRARSFFKFLSLMYQTQCFVNSTSDKAVEYLSYCNICVKM